VVGQFWGRAAEAPWTEKSRALSVSDLLKTDLFDWAAIFQAQHQVLLIDNRSPIFNARGSQPKNSNPDAQQKRSAAVCVAATESNTGSGPSISSTRFRIVCNILLPTPVPLRAGVI
jgi:threonine dehydratase